MLQRPLLDPHRRSCLPPEKTAGFLRVERPVRLARRINSRGSRRDVDDATAGQGQPLSHFATDLGFVTVIRVTERSTRTIRRLARTGRVPLTLFAGPSEVVAR